MRRALAATAVLAVFVGGALGLVAVSGDAHTAAECVAVRARAAEWTRIADAAESQGGLTNGARTWIAHLRNVTARALAHCPLPTSSTAPPTTSTTTSTTTTTTMPTTTTTTMAPPVGGKPNATNTGVPAGTSLTASGSITVTTAGTVIANKLVTGCISVQAANVTIKNTKIAQGCFNGIDIQPFNYPNATNLTIQDVEIDGRGYDNCIAFYGYTAIRVNLHGCADGAKVGDRTTIRDSYIHDLFAPGCHCDAIQNTGGDGTLIDHTVLGGPAMHGNEFGPLRNITIRNSWLEGGLWGGFAGSTMQILNNEISNIGTYGFCCVYVSPDTAWSGNTRPDGQPIPHP